MVSTGALMNSSQDIGRVACKLMTFLKTGSSEGRSFMEKLLHVYMKIIPQTSVQTMKTESAASPGLYISQLGILFKSPQSFYECNRI